MILSRNWLLPVLLAGAAILGTPPPAWADFAIRLTDVNTGQSVVVYDGQAGDHTKSSGSVLYGGDLDSTAGTILVSGTVDNFSLLMSYGTTNSPGVDGANAIVQVGSFSITNNSSSTDKLKVEVSSQGFTTPHSPPAMTVYTTASGSVANGTVTANFTSLADSSNTLFGNANAFSVSLGPLTATGASSWDQGSFSDTASQDGFEASTYSITNVSSFQLTGGARVTVEGGNTQVIQGTTLATPAPGGGVLAITALPVVGMGWFLRRYRKRA
jgi:hypothetical protein